MADMWLEFKNSFVKSIYLFIIYFTTLEQIQVKGKS